MLKVCYLLVNIHCIFIHAFLSKMPKNYVNRKVYLKYAYPLLVKAYYGGTL